MGEADVVTLVFILLMPCASFLKCKFYLVSNYFFVVMSTRYVFSTGGCSARFRDTFSNTVVRSYSRNRPRLDRMGHGTTPAPFTSSDPEIWLALVELKFKNCGINDDTGRFWCITGCLPPRCLGSPRYLGALMRLWRKRSSLGLPNWRSAHLAVDSKDQTDRREDIGATSSMAESQGCTIRRPREVKIIVDSTPALYAFLFSAPHKYLSEETAGIADESISRYHTPKTNPQLQERNKQLYWRGSMRHYNGQQLAEIGTAPVEACVAVLHWS